MKFLKMFFCAALSGMSLMALAAGPAAATTLEVGGVPQNKSVALEITMTAGMSATLGTTDGNFVDTCTSSTLKGSTEGTYTGAVIGGKATSWVTGNCSHSVVNDVPGSVSIEHVKGTTNGTVRSTGARVTVQSTTFGVTLSCTTSSTHLGTLMGSAAGHATLKVNAVVNCGFFVPSATWQSAYTVTSPTGLGVVA